MLTRKSSCLFVSPFLRTAAVTVAAGSFAGAIHAQQTGEFSWANFGTGNYDTAVGIDPTKTFI